MRERLLRLVDKPTTLGNAGELNWATLRHGQRQRYDDEGFGIPYDLYTISIRHLHTLCTNVGQFTYGSLMQQCTGVHGEAYRYKTDRLNNVHTPIDR